MQITRAIGGSSLPSPSPFSSAVSSVFHFHVLCMPNPSHISLLDPRRSALVFFVFFVFFFPNALRFYSSFFPSGALSSFLDCFIFIVPSFFSPAFLSLCFHRVVMGSGNPAARSQAGAGSLSSRDDSYEYYDDLNSALSSYLFLICGCISAAVLLWRFADVTNKYTRKIASLGNDRQKYFAIPSPNMSMLKRHILYAPVLRKRHNREIQLSSAINVGTLPTRLQLLFLFTYFVTNVVFCVIDIPFAANFEDAAGDLRNRSGVLATVNLVRPPISHPLRALCRAC